MKPLVARYAPWIAIAVSALVIAAAVVLQVGAAGIQHAAVAPPPMMSNPF